MNMGQDRQLQMVGGNGGNQFRHTDVSNQVRQNAIQNLSIQNVRNQNGLIVIPRIANSNVNLNGNENVVAARAEGNCNGNNAFDQMAATRDIDEIKEINANCILMENLQ
nr:hypothetical protein [Tanacetum cinerariifolium]